MDPAILPQRRGRLRPLLPRILPAIDLGVALHHGEFAAVSALMEHRGVPIDMEVFAQLADADTWRAVRDAMVPTIDAQYGVYVRNAAGDWTFNMERFAAYLAREGIAWPQLETGKLNMQRKTFEDMSKGWPQLEGLRQLRHTRDKMRKIKLAVGADGRNRTVLWPFKSKTSRTQPKASQWIFSPAVWLRSLIKPEPGMAVAYIDYSAMEFLIAAVLSDGHCGPDNPMLDAYNSGDPYLAFAKRVGAVPRDATKKSHAEVRDRYKVVLLATQYGMQAETLAARAGVSTLRGARDARPASRGVRAILAVVRRLAAARAADRRDAHGDGLDLSHRHHRAQRALDPQLAGAIDAAPTFCGSPASWRRGTASGCWRRSTTRS